MKITIVLFDNLVYNNKVKTAKKSNAEFSCYDEWRVIMDKRVSIAKCKSYAEAERGVREALAPLGGMGAFVKPGDRVIIKPNFVSRKKPDEAATTHPAILHAVICEVCAAGGIATVAESPGGPYNRAALAAVYDGCGADYAVKGTAAVLNYNTEFSEKEFPQEGSYWKTGWR